jgi:hypothetical protein
VVEHFIVLAIIAIIIVVVHSIFKWLTQLSAWFVPVRVYGRWYTFLEAAELAGTQDDPRTPVILSEIAGIKEHEEAELHQFLNWVWGETKKKNNPTVRFVVRGKIVGEKLSLIFRKKNGASSGAILLHVKSGILMRGFEVGSDGETGELYSHHYEWHKR